MHENRHRSVVVRREDQERRPGLSDVSVFSFFSHRTHVARNTRNTSCRSGRRQASPPIYIAGFVLATAAVSRRRWRHYASIKPQPRGHTHYRCNTFNLILYCAGFDCNLRYSVVLNRMSIPHCDRIQRMIARKENKETPRPIHRVPREGTT